jgi:hypothetical protein
VLRRASSGSYEVDGAPVPVEPSPQYLAVAPDGSRLYITNRGSTNYSLTAVDTATLQLQRSVLPRFTQTEPNGIAVSPDGSRLFVTDSIEAGVRVFDAASLRLVQTISWTAGVSFPWGIAVAPDASQIFTANAMSGNLGIVQQVQAAPKTGRGGASLDDQSGGLVIRSSLPGEGWTDCPDIWPSPANKLPDPTILVTQYGNDSPSQVTQQVDNYVYVRAKNTSNGPVTARVWLYWVNASGDPSLILWPQHWGQNGLTPQHFDISAQNLGDITYTGGPPANQTFILDGTVLTGSHYCLVTYLEEPPQNPPLDPRPTNVFQSMDDLAAYFVSHPNVGWKNTSWVTVPQPTWQWNIAVPGPAAGGTFLAGIQCTNMPTDGKYSVVMQGPSGGSIDTGPNPCPITVPDMGFVVPITWPANYSSTMVVTYYQGPTVPTGGITPVGGVESSTLAGRVPNPLRRSIRTLRYREPDLSGIPERVYMTLAGTTPFQFHLPGT